MAGRLAEFGLHLEGADVPRIVAKLRNLGSAWVLTVGPTAKAMIANRWVTAAFEREAQVILPRGRTEARWETEDIGLDLEVLDSLRIGEFPALEPERQRITPERFRGVAISDIPRARGPIAAARLRNLTFSDDVRHTIAITFRHLLDERGVRPRAIYREASAALGKTEDEVKQTINRARQRVNEMRPTRAPLRDADAFGDYVIRRRRIVGRGDL